MATPKKNPNNEGTIYLRKDGRWEGSAYVLTTDGTYKRRSVYGKTWDDAHEKLTKLKADSLSGLPVATNKMTIAEYLTYWLTNIAKGKVRRTTYVNYEALQRVGGELLIQRAQQIADRKGAGNNWKGTGQGLVFTTRNGTPIEPRNLNRSFEALSIRAGVRKVRFHDLRHTCASLLHEQGRRRPHDHGGTRPQLDPRDHGHLHLRAARLAALGLRSRRGCPKG
ncbi:tyrosine-type recombinase/integrase [Streptomyces sp. NBC_01485]|uniref:tyrosine-type recombinase/integrase n=1 Tax=Streptomyces sp. NBC_01485 TaxID=2903884 RepID=UPI002E33500F|nr:tyrosine-type recombinase/integrase [Streptomyces sp. NBC_01485]